jgi:hypothetical protein
MSEVFELWNPRNARSGLRRYWVRMGERMLIDGDSPHQVGVLSFHRPEREAELVAHLKLFDGQLQEPVRPGEDLTIRIRDLHLLVIVRAVQNDRVMLEFGVTPGTPVDITLSGEVAPALPNMALRH